MYSRMFVRNRNPKQNNNKTKQQQQQQQQRRQQQQQQHLLQKVWGITLGSWHVKNASI